MTWKPRLGVTEGHWKWHFDNHLWRHMSWWWFHSNYGSMPCL